MSSFVTKHSKHRKTPKVIKVQWLCIDLMSKWSKQRKTTKAIKWRWIACIWRRIGKNVEFCHKTFNTTQNSKSDQNTMTWIDLMSNCQKCRNLSKRWHSKFDAKLQKCDQNTMTWIDLTSNWQKCRVLSQNIQNNAKLQKWSKYNDLNRFDVELAKMSSFVTKHSKQRKTPKVIKIQWLCIDWMSKWSKQRKTTKSIKLRWIALIWRRIGKNVEFCHKTFKTTQNSKSDQSTMTLHRFDVKMIKTTQNYQSDQMTMNCMHLTSNWQKCRVLSQNIQNNAKLQKWSKYNDLNRFDVELAKMSSFVTKHSKHVKLQKWSKYNDFASILSKWSKQRKTTKSDQIRWIACIWHRIGKNVEFCHKTFKTTQNSKSDQNTMTLHRFDVKMIKTTQNYQMIKLRWIAWIWRRIGKNVEFCHKTFKTTQNSKSDQSTMTLHRFDVKMIKTTQNYQIDQITMNCMIWRRIGKNVEFCHKTFKTTQNSKSDQNTMTWIDLMSNWQKCRVLSQNIQNNAKLQKWSNTMTCIDLTSNWQKCRVLSQNIQNNAKLQKWSKYNDFASIWCRIGKNVEFCHKTFKTPQNSKSDQSTMTLHRFDVELAKMSSFVTKHSKQRKTPKVIKIQWLE